MARGLSGHLGRLWVQSRPWWIQLEREGMPKGPITLEKKDLSQGVAETIDGYTVQFQPTLLVGMNLGTMGEQ